MKGTKVCLAFIVMVGLFLSILTGCCGGSPAASEGKQDFVIGAVLDITGPSSSLGIPECNTLQMLEEQVNAITTSPQMPI